MRRYKNQGVNVGLRSLVRGVCYDVSQVLSCLRSIEHGLHIKWDSGRQKAVPKTAQSLRTYCTDFQSHTPVNTINVFAFLPPPTPLPGVATAHQWAKPSSVWRLHDHTQRDTTLDTTPLDGGSARCRDLHITTRSIPRRDSNPQSREASGRRLTPLHRESHDIGHVAIRLCQRHEQLSSSIPCT